MVCLYVCLIVKNTQTFSTKCHLNQVSFSFILLYMYFERGWITVPWMQQKSIYGKAYPNGRLACVNGNSYAITKFKNILLKNI